MVTPESERSGSTELAETLRREAYVKKWSHIFIFNNTVLIILSITLISVMIGLESYWKFFDPFLYIYREIHGLGVISTSCSIIICGCFGYVISCTKKSSHYIWYGLGLLIMLVLDIKIIITGLVNEDFANNYVNKMYTAGLKDYGKNTATRNSVDTVQLSLMCCGVNNYTDWLDTPTEYVPFSCCPFTNTPKNYTTFYCKDPGNLDMFQAPCLDKLLKVPEYGIILIYSIVTLLVTIKTLCLLLTVKMEKIYK